MNTINTHQKSAGETRTVVVGFGDKLRLGGRTQSYFRSNPYYGYGASYTPNVAFYTCDEFLSGTPTAAEINTSALTISAPTIIQTDQVVNGRLVKALQGVQFAVSGGVAGASYRIRVTATTDASPVQTLTANVGLSVYA